MRRCLTRNDITHNVTTTMYPIHPPTKTHREKPASPPEPLVPREGPKGSPGTAEGVPAGRSVRWEGRGGAIHVRQRTPGLSSEPRGTYYLAYSRTSSLLRSYAKHGVRSVCILCVPCIFQGKSMSNNYVLINLDIL